MSFEIKEQMVSVKGPIPPQQHDTLELRPIDAPMTDPATRVLVDDIRHLGRYACSFVATFMEEDNLHWVEATIEREPEDKDLSFGFARFFIRD